MGYSEDIFQKDMVKVLREIRDEMHRSNQITEVADARNAEFVKEQREFMRGNQPSTTDPVGINEVISDVDHFFGKRPDRKMSEYYFLYSFLDRYPEPIDKDEINGHRVYTDYDVNTVETQYLLELSLKDHTFVIYRTFGSDRWSMEVKTHIVEESDNDV